MIGFSPSGHSRIKDRCAVHCLVLGGEGVGSPGREASGENTWPHQRHSAFVPWVGGSQSVASEKPCQLISSLCEMSSGSHGRARLQLGETSWEATVQAQEQGSGCEPLGSGCGRGWKEEGFQTGVRDRTNGLVTSCRCRIRKRNVIWSF